LVALFVWYGDVVPGGGAFPEPNFAREFKIHNLIISRRGNSSTVMWRSLWLFQAYWVIWIDSL
jgi:hypothetical protein